MEEEEEEKEVVVEYRTLRQFCGLCGGERS